MFLQIEKKELTRNFLVSENLILRVNNDFKLFKNEVFISDKVLDNSYENFKEKIIYSDKTGTWIDKNKFENLSYLKNSKDLRNETIIFSGDFKLDYPNFSNKYYLYNLKTREKKFLLKFKNLFYFFRKNTFLFFSDKIKIYSFIISDDAFVWQFNLETLGKFEDRDGYLQNYEVLKFIGAWQNSILVACSGQLVLDINSKTGELNRKWQALPGYGSSAFQGRLQHKIPSTDGFQLDISKSYLYHLAGAFLVTIDLVTGKADYQSLKNTLEEHVFSGFRWSTGYAEDETHIYTIAEMNRLKLGLDYIPQCIVAFNKKTLKIDWHYRFEGDWVKTDIPQLANNKLYQLSGDNTLYIFEKEKSI